MAELLQLLYHEDNAEIRRRAVSLLGAAPRQEARAALWVAASDRDPAVREMAQGLLEERPIARGQGEAAERESVSPQAP